LKKESARKLEKEEYLIYAEMVLQAVSHPPVAETLYSKVESQPNKIR